MRRRKAIGVPNIRCFALTAFLTGIAASRDDFVILERAEDDFIISYLGIPHPSFEDRQYDHLWLKISGHFSSSLQKRGAENLSPEHTHQDEPARVGVLQVDAKGNYQFNETPPLNRETTKAGLCWDSLR